MILVLDGELGLRFESFEITFENAWGAVSYYKE
jgi:hypothetical protein